MSKAKIDLDQIDFHITYVETSYLVSYFRDMKRDDRTVWGIRIVDKETGYTEVKKPYVGHTPTQKFAKYHLAQFRGGNRGKTRR